MPQELRIDHPLIDLSIYHNRPFLFGNLAAFFAFSSQSFYVILMPFYLQGLLGFGTPQVGLLMTVFPLAMAFVAPLSGFIYNKAGPVALTTAGLLLSSAGLAILSTLNAQSTFPHIFFGPLFMGIGQGLFTSPNNTAVMNSVERQKLGVAGGLNALVRNVGYAIGTSVAVSLFAGRQAWSLARTDRPSALQQVGAFVSAYHITMLVGAALALCGALVSINRKGYQTADASSGSSSVMRV